MKKIRESYNEKKMTDEEIKALESLTDEERKELFEKKLKELVDFTLEINEFYQKGEEE
jgi:hypothetical protein|tara:strand:- start:479 stop:652 length:174 start_codon:yes stop_codon:yes gene_type:complete